jgi:hypothetical protein
VDYIQHVVLTAPVIVFKRGHPDVEDRKDQVLATKFHLALEEQFKLGLAMAAVEGSRRDDRKEKDRLINCRFNLFFPQCAMGNRHRILPQSELSPRATELPT